MHRKKATVIYGKVDIGTQPYFVISYSDTYESDWIPIALMSVAHEVKDLRLALLTHSADDRPFLDMVQEELRFYFLELREEHPVRYLVYHATSTISNIYSNSSVE